MLTVGPTFLTAGAQVISSFRSLAPGSSMPRRARASRPKFITVRQRQVLAVEGVIAFAPPGLT